MCVPYAYGISHYPTPHSATAHTRAWPATFAHCRVALAPCTTAQRRNIPLPRRDIARRNIPPPVRNPASPPASTSVKDGLRLCQGLGASYPVHTPPAHAAMSVATWTPLLARHPRLCFEEDEREGECMPPTSLFEEDEVEGQGHDAQAQAEEKEAEPARLPLGEKKKVGCTRQHV